MSNETDGSHSFIYNYIERIVHFLIPFTKKDFQWNAPDIASNAYSNFTQFLLKNFDADNDGSISPAELLHIDRQHLTVPNKVFFRISYTPVIARLTSWPLVDWNLAKLLWRSCGGLLLLIIVASIIPGRLHALSGRILRWPILALTYLTIFSELIVYVMVRLFIRLAETVFSTSKHRDLRRKMDDASSYDEWLSVAKKLDFSKGKDGWQNCTDDNTSYRYNWAFINELIMDMREARRTRDSKLALAILQQCTRKNVGGIMNSDLFSFTNTGEPKIIVKQFLDEICKTLDWLIEFSTQPITIASPIGESAEHDTYLGEKHDQHKRNIIESAIHNVVGPVFGPVQWVIEAATGGEHETKEEAIIPTPNEKTCDDDRREILSIKERAQVKIFLKRARAAYGRTALCLSGGAMMGCYHFGHVMALLEEGILPHIISGTSAGSVIAALLCTRTDDEIRRDMKPEMLVNTLTCFSRSWPDRFRYLMKHGCLFDQNDWLELIEWFTCGDMTFEEAYQKTGRILCITLSSTTKKAPPILVNYITAPNVTVASAVIASAAVPGFIKPVTLRKKGSDGVVRVQEENKDEAYWDGSIDQDIPTSGLAEMFNCQFFLTAQCNPHIVPFFHSFKGDVAAPSRWSRGGNEDDAWRGGILLAALERYLKNDMKSKFHFLNDLEAAVGFTSTMMTQEYHGSTTIVPQVSVLDYFQLFSNPSLPFLKKCFQVGNVAAYKHCAMMKMHYKVANALDRCLAILEDADGSAVQSRRRNSELAQYYKALSNVDLKENQQGIRRARGFSINASTPFQSECSNESIAKEKNSSMKSKESELLRENSSASSHDDECELAGFDGMFDTQ